MIVRSLGTPPHEITSWLVILERTFKQIGRQETQVDSLSEGVSLAEANFAPVSLYDSAV